MINWILRHGQTDYSVQHLVNGDPAGGVELNSAGRQTCLLRRASSRLHDVSTWITSEFPRAQQTASLLMEPAAIDLVIDPRLNELSYGIFEGGPFLSYGAWLEHHGADKRPDGAAESQREGILRMLNGLQAVTKLPGDRVIVGHGLLVSVLKWGLSSSRDETLPLFLPEAPYVDPLMLNDDELTDLATTLADRIRRPDTSGRAATFDGKCPLLEMKDSRHA